MGTGGLTPTSIRISPDVLHRLDGWAEMHGMTRTAYLQAVIEEHVMAEKLQVVFSLDLASKDECELLRGMLEGLGPTGNPKMAIRLTIEAPAVDATRSVATMLADLAAAKERAADREQPRLWQDPSPKAS